VPATKLEVVSNDPPLTTVAIPRTLAPSRKVIYPELALGVIEALNVNGVPIIAELAVDERITPEAIVGQPEMLAPKLVVVDGVTEMGLNIAG
jgi:hypothetical protein